MEFNKKAFTKNMPYMLLGISIIVLSIIVTIFLSKSDLENEVVDLNDKDIDIKKLVISEVMSSNKGVHVDKEGNLYDYVEIYNGTNHDINLKNYSLSDNKKDSKWAFPDIVIKSKEYLVVYLCGEKKEGLYANFGLSSSKGEIIVLKKPNGKIIDAIDISKLSKNEVMMRDGDGKIVISKQATPGYENTISGHKKYLENLKDKEDKTIKINEFLPRNKGNFKNNDGLFSGYIEVTNISNDTINLKGYSLSNDYNILYKWQFPDIVIMPKETIFVYTSSNNRSEGYYTGFKLNEKNGSVILSSKNGKIIDEVTYEGLENGIAYVRDQDDFYTTNSISPGYSNNNDGVNKFANKYLVNGNDLIINEVMNSNSSYLPQNGGEYYDWIELKNNSKKTINLSDYYLTKNENIKDTYKLPDYELKAGEYYVIMASGDSNLSNNSYKHANFKIGKTDSIYLVKDNKIIDSVFVANIPTNYSMGRNNNSGYFYFSKPTPLKSNGEGTRQIAYIPSFDTKSGVYNNVSNVEVKIKGSGTIYYTLDGSIPNKTSKVYNGSLFLDKSTVVKAMNYVPGQLYSETIVSSYIINENDHLPVLSISMNQTDFNYLSANAWTADEEREAYAELFEDGKGFSIPCGFKLFGASTRSLPKKSFAIKFKKKYGASKLNYQVFPNRDYSAYDSLVIRSGSQDYETTFFRDILMTSLVEDLDTVDVQAYKSVSLYINGKYWGVYNIREKVDDKFISNHYNVNAEDVKIVRIDNDVTAGDNIWYKELTNYLSTNNMANSKNYEYIKTKIDIDSIIDFWITETYFTNNDIVNARFYTHPSINRGRMRSIAYDFDWAMYNYSKNYYEFSTSATPMSRLQISTVVLRNLMKNEEFKKRYVERLAYHMKNTFTEEKVLARINEMHDKLKVDLKKDFKRWNLDFSKWEGNVEDLRKYARLRGGYMIKQAKTFFKLTDKEMKKYFGDLYG